MDETKTFYYGELTKPVSYVLHIWNEKDLLNHQTIVQTKQKPTKP